MQPIEKALWKIHLFHFGELLFQFVLIGAAGWLCWILAASVGDQYLPPYNLYTLLFGGAWILIFLTKSLALFLSRNDSRIAAELDQRFQLKDRLTTYLELRKTEHPFREALTTDIETKIQPLSMFQASNFLHGTAPPLILVIILLIAVLALPFLPVPKSIAARKQHQEEITREARKLQHTLNKMLEENRQDPELKKLLQQLQKAAQELEKTSSGKAGALKKLNSLQDQLTKRNEKLQEANKAKLAKAWKEFSKQEIAKMNPAERQEWDQLAKEFEKEMGNQQKGGGQEKPGGRGLSRTDIEKLKKAMSDYQSQKDQIDKSAAELEEALEKARSGMMTASGHKVTKDSEISDRDIEKGKGGVEDGPGTTNKDLGPQRFDTKKQQQGEYVEDKTRAEYEKLYDGQRENVGKDPFFIDSQWNPDGDPTYQRIRSFGVDSDPELKGTQNQSAVQNPEESEVRKERIPPSYQKIVKKYFESIQE